MFTPELSTTALRTMKEKYGDKVYGRYGFIDAFNPATGWYDTEVIGINVGIILLSAENARTGRRMALVYAQCGGSARYAKDWTGAGTLECGGPWRRFVTARRYLQSR
jgi:hypothetical protein